MDSINIVMYVDLTRLKWYVSQPSQDSIRFFNFLWGSIIRLTAAVGTVCFLYVVSYIVTRLSNPYSHDSLYFLVRVSQIWKICTGVTCVKRTVIYGPHYTYVLKIAMHRACYYDSLYTSRTAVTDDRIRLSATDVAPVFIWMRQRGGAF